MVRHLLPAGTLPSLSLDDVDGIVVLQLVDGSRWRSPRYRSPTIIGAAVRTVVWASFPRHIGVIVQLNVAGVVSVSVGYRRHGGDVYKNGNLNKLICKYKGQPAITMLNL